MTTTAAELEAAYVAGEDVKLADIEKARRAEYAAALDAQREAAAAERERAAQVEDARTAFLAELADFLSDGEMGTLRDLYTEALVVVADLIRSVDARRARQTEFANRAFELGLSTRKLTSTGASAAYAPTPELTEEWRAAFIGEGVLEMLADEAKVGYRISTLSKPAPHTLVSDERRADYEALEGAEASERRTLARELLARRVEASHAD